MNTVTQTMLFRQALIKYAKKHGVTQAAIKYKTNRQYIYRWKFKYDLTIELLINKSNRLISHPSQHTDEELKLIKYM